MTSILTAALTLAANGYSVIPLAPGSKRPGLTSWEQHQRTPAPPEQITAWHETGNLTGIGVVCGAVSGGLELAELEGRATHKLPELADLADASGLGPLWARVRNGWCELSPNGGIHFLYRVEGPVAGNTRLARSPHHEVYAETRGEGGQVVVAPTGGNHHPTGNAWQILSGGPATAPTLTTDERDAIHDLLRTLDETPEPATADRRPDNPPGAAGDGTRPGDAYEKAVDWADILKPHGWTHITTRGTTRYWRRPGKTEGISATTGRAQDRDRLYVFSSSTVFEQEQPYTKLGAYALLEHAGDHSAAARALRAAGYGSDPATTLTGLNAGAGIINPAALTVSTPGNPSPAGPAAATPPTDSAPPPASDGNLATVHHLPAPDPEPSRTSWWPRDLTAVIAGHDEEPPPAFLARQDGHRLFYAAKVNGLIGESENGKSWVAQYTALQTLQVGQPVLYLDFEDTAPGVVARLRAMGADDQHLQHLAYIGPDEMLHAGAKNDLEQTLTTRAPALIILDGFNAAMTLLGLDLESNTDATKFAQLLLMPLSRTGAAVVYVDHVPKNKDARGKGGIGAQAKRAMTTGCALLVDVEKEFGRGMTGRLKLTVDKDRPGHVRAHSAAAKNAGTVVLQSRKDGTVAVHIEAPDLRPPAERGPWRPTTLMERASRLLEDFPDGLSGNAVEKQLGGTREHVRAALAALVEDRYAKREPGARGALLHVSTRPYRAPTAPTDGILNPTSPTSPDLADSSPPARSETAPATSPETTSPYGEVGEVAADGATPQTTHLADDLEPIDGISRILAELRPGSR